MIGNLPSRKIAPLGKRGFTLAEALVLTILVGYCMVPILGVMSDSVSRVQDFDHRETLRVLARSRLNEGISRVSYDRKPFDLSLTFHYVYTDPSGNEFSADSDSPPHVFLVDTGDSFDVDKIKYSYKVEMSFQEQLDLNDDTAAPSVNVLYKQGTAGLRALVARSTFLSVDDPTTATIEGRENSDPNEDISVSLMSLVTTPVSHHHQRVIVSDPGQIGIYSLDTEFLNLVKIYRTYTALSDLPNQTTLSDNANDPWRPAHLAIHPSGNWLAVKMKQKIKLININEESSDNGKNYDVFAFTGGEAGNTFLEDPGDNDLLKEDDQIVFRPDGKYCFVTGHSPYKLYRFEVSRNLFDPTWVPDSSTFNTRTEVALNYDEVRDMTVGDDGRLYLANGSDLVWFSMFRPLSEMTHNRISTFANSESYTNSIDTVSLDRTGRRVFLGFDDSTAANRRLIWVPAAAQTDLPAIRHVETSTTFTDYSKMSVPGNRQIRDSIVSPDNKYFGMAAYGADRCYMTSNPPDITFWKDADPCTGNHYQSIVHNPNMQTFIVDQDYDGVVHMLNVKDMANGILSSPQMPNTTAIKFGGSANNICDVAARAPEYLLVGVSDTSVHSVEYIDTQARTRLLKSIILSAAPTHLAMNAAGSRVKVTFAGARYTFDTFSCEAAPSGELAADQKAAYDFMTAYSIDADKDSATGKDDFFACVGDQLTEGLFTTQSPMSGINDTPDHWIVLDMLAMNKGGFLVLYKHETIGGLRMVRWFGKFTYGPSTGKYALFANFVSSAHNFPPEYAGKMAISADDGLISFVSFYASGDNKVSVYDFRSQNFEHQTEMPGLISTYHSNAADPLSDPAIKFCDQAPTTPSGLVGYWKFDEGTSGTTADSSGNGYTGTINGASWNSSGRYGNCLSFDGSDDYVSISGGTNLNLNGDNFTIAAWLYSYQDDSGYHGFIGKEVGSNQDRYPCMYVNGNTKIHAGFGDGTNWNYFTTGAIFSENCWQHIAFTFDGSTMRIYANGVEAYTSSGWSGRTPVSGSALEIGRLDNYFKGKIDEVQVFNCALGATEIKKLAASGQPLPGAFTANETWTYTKDYPGNMWFLDTWGVPLNGLDLTKATSSKRYFGYWSPGNLAVKYLGLGIRDGGRMFYDGTQIMNQGFGSGNTNVGALSAQTPDLFSTHKVQIEHTVNGATNIGIAPLLSTNTSPGTPTVGDANTEHDAGGRGAFVPVSPWERIPQAKFTPFKFAPKLLHSFDLSGNGNDNTAVVYSRDCTDPILYILDDDNNCIWIQRTGKSSPCKIQLPTIDYLDNVLAIAHDGQKLFFAGTDGVPKHYVFIVDIAMPTTFAFGSTIDVSSTDAAGGDGFGSIIGRIDMGAPIKCLATRPFGGTHDGDRYEIVKDMDLNVANLNIAAVSNGGIFIMGGAEDGDGSPRKNVYKFNPITGAFSDLGVKMNKTVRNHSVIPFEDQLIAFNGYDGSDQTDWVQTYNPKSGAILTSTDPIPSGVVEEIRVTHAMTAANAPSSAVITSSSSGYTGDEHWRAWDHIAQPTSDPGRFGVNNNSAIWTQYDAGHPDLAFICNKIILDNWSANSNSGARDWTLKGGATLLCSNTGQTDCQRVTKTFSNPPPSQTYRVDSSANSGNTSWHVITEVELYCTGVTNVTPDMTGQALPAPFTVTHDACDGTDEGWKAFDRDTSTTWTSSDNVVGHSITIFMGVDTIVDIIRMQANVAFGNNNRVVTGFTFWGSHDGSAWDILKIVTAAPVNNLVNNYFFTNSVAYKYYKLTVNSHNGGPKYNIDELQLYSTQGGPLTDPTVPHMLKTSNDDHTANSWERNAACLTPYGPIFSGGTTDGSTVSDKTCVYWPHGLDKYDATAPRWGISRNLPAMPGPRVDHCLVWHKGYLYRIGGSSTVGGTPLASYDRFNFSTNNWAPQSVSGAQATALQRRKAAACSFGDEIFVFGGFNSSNAVTSTAAAWNPDTGNVRTLRSIEDTSDGSSDTKRPISISAVPCGPFIYLIGGSSGETIGGGEDIVRYCP